MSLTVKLTIKAIDQATATVRRVNDAIGRATAPVRAVRNSMRSLMQESGLPRLTSDAKNVASSLGVAGREARNLGLKIGVIGGGIGWLLKTQLIDTASEFERFQTILETVEGSNAKAQQSMDWVSDFAARTPFELGDVTDAFVKLRAYGLDPTDGLLRTLGDTSAAMGKPLTQGVEAMADAITGEYERLKEFGIRARSNGQRVAFEYTSNGKTMRKFADVSNRAQVQSTLSAIWNERYAGAMDKQSRTWIGMMSNLSDQWTRFKVMIMKNGVFDWLSERLRNLLATVDKMAADGSLQKLAAEIGVKLKTALIELWGAMKAVIDVMRMFGSIAAYVADLVGGWRNLMIGLAAIMAGKFLYALWGVVTTLNALNLTLLGTPLGWLLAGLAAFALVALHIIKYWEPIKSFFSGLWDGVLNGFKSAYEWIVNGIIKINDLLPRWVKTYTPQGMLINAAATRLGPAATGAAAPSAISKSSTAQSTAMSGALSVDIKIDQDGRARVRDVRSSNRAIDLNVDAGLRGAGS